MSGVLDELKAGGGRVHYVQADIADAGQRGRIVAEVTSALGTPSALVNNAGRGPRVRADLLDASEESFEELRPDQPAGAVLPDAGRRQRDARRPLRARAAASSSSPRCPRRWRRVQRGDYCVSKAGLSMAAKLFAVRLAPEGIPVFEVRPGIIATDMTAGVKEKYDQRIAEGLIPDPRWGTPDDVGPSGGDVVARRRALRDRDRCCTSTAA